MPSLPPALPVVKVEVKAVKVEPVVSFQAAGDLKGVVRIRIEQVAGREDHRISAAGGVGDAGDQGVIAGAIEQHVAAEGRRINAGVGEIDVGGDEGIARDGDRTVKRTDRTHAGMGNGNRSAGRHREAVVNRGDRGEIIFLCLDNAGGGSAVEEICFVGAAERQRAGNLAEGAAVDGVVSRDDAGAGIADETEIQRIDAGKASDVDGLRGCGGHRSGRSGEFILELQHLAAAVVDGDELDVVVLIRAKVNAGLIVRGGKVIHRADKPGLNREDARCSVELGLKRIDLRVISTRIGARGGRAGGGDLQHAGGGVEVDQVGLILVGVLIDLNAGEAGALAVFIDDAALVGGEIQIDRKRAHREHLPGFQILEDRDAGGQQ